MGKRSEPFLAIPEVYRADRPQQREDVRPGLMQDKFMFDMASCGSNKSWKKPSYAYQVVIVNLE